MHQGSFIARGTRRGSDDWRASGDGMRVLRALVALVLAIGLLTLAAGPATGAPVQAAPPATVVPQLPPEVTDTSAAVSPVVWQACQATGLAIGAIVVAGALIGVPPDVGVPLNAAIATATGPVLGLFFELCQQIPLPDAPPDSATDLQVPPLPSLGRPILPAALLASELRALDASLTAAGVPFAGALGDAADDLLACAAGQNPEPDTIPSLDPDVAGSGSVDGSTSPSKIPRLTERSLDGLAGGVVDVPPSGIALPAVQAAGSSESNGSSGTMLLLVALAGLAAAGWLHAGSRRGRTSSASRPSR